MGNVVSGRKGSVNFGTAGTYDSSTKAFTPPTTSAAIANMSSWKLDITTDLLEAPVFGMDAWKKSVAGLKSWSGSADGYFDVSDTAGQAALQTAALNATESYFDLKIDDAHGYQGNAFIGKISIDEPSDNLVKFSFEIKGNGALAYNN